MTIIESATESPGEESPGGSGLRSARDEVARFGHPLTRMLLASDGFTMPVLEAIIRTPLQVRVLRQDDVAADRIPVSVTDALRVSGTDRVIVRRSCLIDPDMVTVSVNHVVTVSGPAAATGVDDVQMPIGYSLISRGVAQRRHILRAGLMRWPDGRLCATKAYIIVLGDRPLCYIRESFNPDVIPPDHDPTVDDGALHWADEPAAAQSGSPDLATALPTAYESSSSRPAAAEDTSPRNSVERLRTLPPLVHPDECDDLTEDLAAAGRGQAFALHLGHGAEISTDTRTLDGRRALIQAAAAVLTHGLGTDVRVVAIGRLAGRSEPGAMPVSGPGNGTTGDERSRPPDPLLQTYFHAAAALNYWRGCPLPLTLSAEILHRAGDRCAEPALGDLLREVAGLLPQAAAAPAASRELFSSVSRLHISHEVSALPYDSALTRRGPHRQWWDCATQLLWVGDRLRNSYGHLRFAARIRNPVAVVLGPTSTPDDVELLCRRLNPENQPGRLTLVPRLDADRAGDQLPALFDAAARCGTPVCWMCDPTHIGARTHNGHRHVDDVIAGIGAFFQACRDTRTVPGGMHLDTAPTMAGLEGWDEQQTLQCVVTALTELRAV